MAELKLANGTAIKDVRVWNGTKWISRIVRVRANDVWVDCYRPTYFSDNGTTVTNANRRTTTAFIDDGLLFATNLTYTVSKS